MVGETKASSNKARDDRTPPTYKQRKLPRTLYFIPSDHLFAAFTGVLLAKYQWPLRWLLSGAPILTYCLLMGAAKGYRVLPFLPLSLLILLINFAYSIAATSWLIYWVYFAVCYPAILLTCLFQFSPVSRLARRGLRSLLKNLQFTNDMIALFDLPALEIDTEVDGLMCIRGASFSFSTLTLVAYGIEVGIKFTDDMEVALVTDKVVVKLFRRIDIGDVYGNIKGGEFEMTFGKLAKRSEDSDNDSIMTTDTPMLSVAASTGDASRPDISRLRTMTDNRQPVGSTSLHDSFGSVKQLSPLDKEADKKFWKLVKWIDETSIITTSRQEVQKALGIDDEKLNEKGWPNDIRAAICSQLHDKPSVPHPAEKSIKVTTLKNLSSPRVKRFQHRFPLLLRLLLNPIAYFHPVFIESITVGGSGKFLRCILEDKIFTTGSSDANIKNLKIRILGWLADANFLLELADIRGQASVPINTVHDIINYMSFGDIMAYRTLAREVDLTQIVRLAGADARISLPSFLLPHHEHILPPPPTEKDRHDLQQEVDDADGMPNRIHAQKTLDNKMKDETNMDISAHVSLPAVFDQSLLDFVSALVKATKFVEMEKEDLVKESDHRGFKKIARDLGAEVQNGMRRVAIDAATNDRWIAKLVGKVTKKLEDLVGDVGYSGSIPIALDVYRKNAETASKIMP